MKSLKLSLAAALIAAGSLFGFAATQADATIGPFGGRYLIADPPTKVGSYIQSSFYIYGNGGNQTVDLRLRRFYNGQWWIANTVSYNVPSGSVSYGQGFLYPCSALPSGTYIYQTQTKWASYAWSQADLSAGKSLTCP